MPLDVLMIRSIYEFCIFILLTCFNSKTLYLHIHTRTHTHRASPRSAVMESPKKRNQQLKVGILHLFRRQKKIRIELRSKCVTWKVICKSCISQRPGLNLDLGAGVKVKIIPKEEHRKMPETGMLSNKMQSYVRSHLHNIILLIIEG